MYGGCKCGALDCKYCGPAQGHQYCDNENINKCKLCDEQDYCDVYNELLTKEEKENE